MLPDGTIDLVLLVNSCHHIEDRPAYFARLRSDLSARGRASHEFLPVQIFEVFEPDSNAD